MKTGRFGISDTDDERYAIGFNEKTYSEYTLHCGDSFQIELNNKWIGVRIELGSDGWYLIDEDGKKRDVPYGSVRARLEN